MLGVERSPFVVMRRSCIKNYKSSPPPLAVLQTGQCAFRQDDRNDYYGLGLLSYDRFIRPPLRWPTYTHTRYVI